MLRFLFFLTGLCLLVTYWRLPNSPPNSKLHLSPAPKTRPNRIVAVGDLHSDLPQALAVLRMAHLVDDDGNWSGGRDTLVQTGDIVDRGPDTIALYELFEKLRIQAKAVGGKIVNLYGKYVPSGQNHEVMNIGQDLRYVTEEDFESFGGRQQRKDAWDVKTGWLGKMIFRNFNITYVHNGHTVFSHGDMEPEWAKLGVDTLNHQAQEAIWNSNFYAPIFRGTGPIWSRGHAMEEGGMAATCRRIEQVKKALGVRRLISGHTPQYETGKVLSICDGSYMVIDVGISKYYGGHLAALEIIEHSNGEQSVNALYPGGKTLV